MSVGTPTAVTSDGGKLKMTSPKQPRRRVNVLTIGQSGGGKSEFLKALWGPYTQSPVNSMAFNSLNVGPDGAAINEEVHKVGVIELTETLGNEIVSLAIERIAIVYKYL
jgi:predicted GTPase